MKKMSIMALVVFLSFGLSSWAQAQFVSPVFFQSPQDEPSLVIADSGINGDQQLNPFLSGISGLLDRNRDNSGTDMGSFLSGMDGSTIERGILPHFDGNQQYWKNIIIEMNTSILRLLDGNSPGTVDSAPLPAAVWLFGGGLISLVCMRRKRTR
jgi:hypothetical protein